MVTESEKSEQILDIFKGGVSRTFEELDVEVEIELFIGNLSLKCL